MKYVYFLLLMMTISVCGYAKIWRVNNTPGVNADFTSFGAAITAAAAGDSIYFEPSTINYATGNSLDKRVVVIGPGYFLDPANTTMPANTGLQAATTDARLDFFQINAGAQGSKFLGVTIAGSIYLNNVSNISFEKVLFRGGAYFSAGTLDNISFRKCFFSSVAINCNTGSTVITNFTAENNIFFIYASVGLETLTGSGNLFRNNTIIVGNPFNLPNTYIANNIFEVSADNVFTNSTIKNNFFSANQTLPGTATGNQVNIPVTNLIVGGNTGSLDSRLLLKTGSPAIGAGLTVGAVVSPDCGAFGATDPYKLSGIPNIPSIYALTVPVSIASGTNTMNITFSTKNNN